MKEQLLLIAIDKNIPFCKILGNGYTALQVADVLSTLELKGYIEFNEDFSINLTSTGKKYLEEALRKKKWEDFFAPLKQYRKKTIKEFEIYFPKKQNLLQTTSEHIHKNI